MLYPIMLGEVLADQERKTLCIGGGVPVPLNESTGEFEALLAKETVPEAAPVACGVNATVNCTLLPTAIVTGKDSPLRVNSELLTLADVTVTLAPVALSVAGRFSLVPTTRLPKAKLAGVTVNCPAAVPVPDSARFKVGFDAFEETARFPLALPADGGVKMTPKVILCPDVRVNGGLRPVTLKAVPVTVS
jgi:hypothetical protein